MFSLSVIWSVRIKIMDKSMKKVNNFLCPHCGKTISEKLIVRHFASKGGKLSKRVLTPEQARIMVKAREKKRLKQRDNEPHG